MKRRLTPLLLAVPLLLVGCSGTQYEGTPDGQAAAGCSDAVTAYAEDPVEAELVSPIEADVRETNEGELPEDSAYKSLNFGEVKFITGTGAPELAKFVCISYHDENGDLTHTQEDVYNPDDYTNVGYTYRCDQITYGEVDLEDLPDPDTGC